MESENPELIYKRDGHKWLCHRWNFIDLQRSAGGFGDTKQDAFHDLLREEQKQSSKFESAGTE